MSAEMSLNGIDELLNRINDMGRKGSSIENTALTAAAQPILDDAKATAQFHDRSGNLRKGLEISKVKTQNGIKYVLVGIDKSDNSKIFYGKFIEFGTTKMPAKPFLAPAYERHKGEVIEIIKNELKKGLGL